MKTPFFLFEDDFIPLPVSRAFFSFTRACSKYHKLDKAVCRMKSNLQRTIQRDNDKKSKLQPRESTDCQTQGIVPYKGEIYVMID